MAKSPETTFKFTKKRIEGLVAPDPSGKQRLLWDSELTGFGVLVSGVSKATSYVVQRKLPGGKTRRVTVAATNVLDLDDARDRAKEVLKVFYERKDPKTETKVRRSEGLTLRQAMEAYLLGRKGLRDKSKADYRRAVERHLTAWLDLPLRDITPEMVEARHVEIKDEIEAEAKNKDRAIAYSGGATANGVMRVLRAIWYFTGNRQPTGASPMPENPVRRLGDAWYHVARRKRLVRTEDMPAFYKAVDAFPNRTISDYIKLLLFTGMRRTEAASLRWTDLHFAERKFVIPEDRTKSGEELVLPMTDLVHGLLVARQNLGRENQYVFPASGKHGYLQAPQFALKAVFEATGIKVSAHDLRRTFLTVAESADISTMALKALVNHSTGSDITAGYIQLTLERLRAPAQLVADRIRALCKIVEPKNVKRIGGKR